MAGSLMVRSFERSDRVYSAMLSRGYDGEIRSLHEPAITAKDWGILIIAILLLAGIMALGLLLGA
jgi:cobalt/nickel transport system permease protein